MKLAKLLYGVVLSAMLFGCSQKETHVEVSSVSLNTATLEMAVGETANLLATILPKDAEYDDLLWASSNVSVASVKSGTVTALKEGSAIITASAGGKSSTCSVTVSAEGVFVNSITLDKTYLSLQVGDSEKLIATVAPSNASVRTVIWASSNPDIASVSSGIVTALKEGTVIITASAGGKSSTCSVTVFSKVVEVTSITLDKTSLSLQVGDSEKLTATVAPSNASNKIVTWTSSDESIATATDGKVTALKAGSVIVTAKAGSCTAECSVTINGHVESVTLDRQTLSLTVGETAELVVDVKPLGIANVVWDSSNSSVASVNNGVVKAVSEGVAVIKAQVGDKSAECTVNVTENGKKNYFYFCTSYGTNAVHLKVYDPRNDDGGGVLDFDYKRYGPNIEYSYDGVNWNGWKETGYDWLELGADYKLYLRGSTGLSTSQMVCIFEFKDSNPNVICRGSINVLYYYLSEIEEVKTPYAFMRLFENATALITAPDLPFKSVSDNCYLRMFKGCKSLTVSPELPAVKLSQYCYDQMFMHCISLRQVPQKLPAEILEKGCYRAMFADCSSLVEAPEICATAASDFSCESMFEECKSLIKVQTMLPAVLGIFGYSKMYQNCTSLEYAPSLPAKIVPHRGYLSMFSGCKSLQKAPFLSAESLGDDSCREMFKDCISMRESQDMLLSTVFMRGCCYEMFRGCLSLLKAPNIVATTIGGQCCKSMFMDCKAMVKAPDVLPAMDLATECYYGMFSGCSSMTKAPILPALKATDNVYSYMFRGCQSLNYIKCMLTEYHWAYTRDWVKSVSLYGTFVKNSNSHFNDVDWSSSIPPEWTVIDADE